MKLYTHTHTDEMMINAKAIKQFSSEVYHMTFDCVHSFPR